MTEQQLKDILSIEKDLTSEISLDAVVDQFVTTDQKQKNFVSVIHV